MSVQRVNDYLYLTDVKPMGFPNFIASYTVIGDKIAIVETGPTSTVNNLLKGLDEIGVKRDAVNYILVSHIHLDHAGGVGTLMKQLPNAKLIVHSRGAPHMINPEKLWTQSKQVLGRVAELYEAPEPISPDRIIPASDGQMLDLGRGVRLEEIETLGHASHHFSYLERNSGILFPGDAAGIYLNQFDVIVPTTPSPFHLETTLASIDKLKRENPKLLCYTHFGVARDAMEKLDRHAAQLKLWAEIVAEELRRGETLDNITKIIHQRDPAVRTVEDYVKTHPILGQGTLRIDVKGFVDYLQK